MRIEGASVYIVLRADGGYYAGQTQEGRSGAILILRSATSSPHPRPTGIFPFIH